MLEALAEEPTTGTLARDLGVSPASASQHATALREAGLIATRREGKAAWHERRRWALTCCAAGWTCRAAASEAGPAARRPVRSKLLRHAAEYRAG